MRMKFTSPRATAQGHSDASLPNSTSPISTAAGSMYTFLPRRGMRRDRGGYSWMALDFANCDPWTATATARAEARAG